MSQIHLLKMLFLLNLIVLLAQIEGQKACLEEERIGLLELKSFLKLEVNGSDHLLPSWVDDPRSDCCGWERVTCNSTNGWVVELSLFNIGESDLNFRQCSDDLSSSSFWNITLFHSFKELKTLNLSNNRITWKENQGPKGFLRLQQLETLDLSCNRLINSNLQSLRKLKSLKNLILFGNNLNGSFPARELSVFENLETLDLSGNTLGGDSSPTTLGFKGFLRLQQLETLDLSGNSLISSNLQSLRKLKSLKNLILRFNLLNGSFPARELSVFENLETLDLSWNKLSGDSPTTLDSGSFPKLRDVMLLGNSFNTDIMRFLGSLLSLRSLDLSNNGLEGVLSNQDLQTFGRLEVLDLSDNSLAGGIPQNIGKLSSLKVLYLTINQFNGSLPVSGLCELKRLEVLDISSNSFEGILPPCLSNLTSLKILDLHSNLFSGSIAPNSITSSKFLQYIDISSNDFEGSLSLSSIFNYSELEVIAIGGREDKLQIDNDNQAGNPLFQLKVLLLSNCNMKNVLNCPIPAQGKK